MRVRKWNRCPTSWSNKPTRERVTSPGWRTRRSWDRTTRCCWTGRHRSTTLRVVRDAKSSRFKRTNWADQFAVVHSVATVINETSSRKFVGPTITSFVVRGPVIGTLNGCVISTPCPSRTYRGWQECFYLEIFTQIWKKPIGLCI